MASEEHKKCANVVKNVHSSLRMLAKEVGYEEAWNMHCKDYNTLQCYAENMKILATNCWDKNASLSSKTATSRISWISNYCLEYFFDKIIKYRCREENIAIKNKIMATLKQVELIDNVIEVLDVGSCYNPLKHCNFMNVLPIDLFPGDESVFKCDFLNVHLGKQNVIQKKNKYVSQLNENYFDAVIFSLLLEYFPASSQRKECCLKAYKVLKTEGILLIITPDSKHVGANAKIMKNWRYTLSLMGFSRIHYEKLPFLHCMVFRKSIAPEIAQRWANIYKEIYMENEIHIPQDFNDSKKSLKLDCSQYIREVEDVKHTFQFLPYCNSDESCI